MDTYNDAGKDTILSASPDTFCLFQSSCPGSDRVPQYNEIEGVPIHNNLTTFSEIVVYWYLNLKA